MVLSQVLLMNVRHHMPRSGARPDFLVHPEGDYPQIGILFRFKTPIKSGTLRDRMGLKFAKTSFRDALVLTLLAATAGLLAGCKGNTSAAASPERVIGKPPQIHGCAPHGGTERLQ